MADPDDKLVDPIDIACQKEMADREAAISHARLANRPETHPDFEPPYCIDCGVEIEAARLAMGRIRCFDCQTIKEKLQKLRGT